LQLAERGHLKALSKERVADFLDLVFGAACRGENDQVDRFGFAVLLEVLEIGQGLSSGGSE